MYLYIKALHIIFMVTWFAGLFYMPRLLIYNAEANLKPPVEREILQSQFLLMQRRLWYGITWPSAVLTLLLGGSTWYLLGVTPVWLQVKLFFVLGLYLYHFSLQRIFGQQQKGVFRYSSHQLRLWNEVATIFLVAIVMLVVVKQFLSAVWGIAGLLIFIGLLVVAISVYKKYRQK